MDPESQSLSKNNYKLITHQENKKMNTLRRSTERRPLRMHSLSPVPSTITSYSSSMAETQSEKERETEMEGIETNSEKDSILAKREMVSGSV